MDNKTRLAKQLNRDKSSATPFGMRQAVVTSSSYPGTVVGPQVLVQVAGGTPFPVYFFDSCFPLVGDTVWLAKQGVDWWIVGRMSDSADQWIPITLLNGWTNYGLAGGIFHEVAGYKVRPDGDVEFRGLIKHATITTTGILCTLPSNLIVTNRQILSYTAANGGFARIDIDPSSSSLLLRSYNNGGDGADVSLNSVRYRPDYA